jgi:hemolysin III
MSIEDCPPYFKRSYSPAELRADGCVHALAILGGLIGFAALFSDPGETGDLARVAALSVYALAFFLLFGFSCAYNLCPPRPAKWILRRFDHAAIFLMMSGAYTALVAQTMRGGEVLALLAAIWAASIGGAAVALLAAPGRFDRVLLALYFTIGWGAMLGAPGLMASLPAQTRDLTVAGGVVCSLGVPFHLWNSLKFQNAIWHGFVTVGTALQFAGIAFARGHGG